MKSHYINNVKILPHRYKFTCNAHTFSALSLSLDVLHTSTSSASSTPSTNSSHPAQGRYQPFLYLLCAIQGACHYSSFKPPNARTIPCTPISGISFRVLHQVEALRSRTPPRRLEVILFTESPNSRDSPLMCAEQFLTKCLTSGRPQNA